MKTRQQWASCVCHDSACGSFRRSAYLKKGGYLTETVSYQLVTGKYGKTDLLCFLENNDAHTDFLRPPQLNITTVD